MIHNGILKKAISMAKKSNMEPFKIGAVIFQGKRIFASGFNKKGFCGKIHPKYRNEYDSMHAEQHAIFNVKEWSTLNGASILIVRLTKSGYLSMAKPCDMCMEMIKHVGIKEIYYTNHNSEIIKENIWEDINV